MADQLSICYATSQERNSSPSDVYISCYYIFLYTEIQPVFTYWLLCVLHQMENSSNNFTSKFQTWDFYFFVPLWIYLLSLTFISTLRPFDYFILLTIAANCVVLSMDAPHPSGDRTDLNIELVRKYWKTIANEYRIITALTSPKFP